MQESIYPKQTLQCSWSNASNTNSTKPDQFDNWHSHYNFKKTRSNLHRNLNNCYTSSQLSEHPNSECKHRKGKNQAFSVQCRDQPESSTGKTPRKIDSCSKFGFFFFVEKMRPRPRPRPRAEIKLRETIQTRDEKASR